MIEERLKDTVLAGSFEGKLREAMCYAVMGNGKRLRPSLVYATAKTLHLPESICHSSALAVELIHCYSLVHDDLPAMDDAPLRRGQPSCHKKFGEATAILVGDALHVLAFECIAKDTTLAAEQRCYMIDILAKAAGAKGMVEGQMRDIANDTHTLEAISTLHTLKTGKLIEASIALPCVVANLTDTKKRTALESFSNTLGIAYQIQDDILDKEGETTLLGKRKGTDALSDKTTYPDLVGLVEAKKTVQKLIKSCQDFLSAFGQNRVFLSEIVNTLSHRSY